MIYKLSKDGVRRLEDGALIPNDTANTDYQEYLKWVAAGNTAAPEFTSEEQAVLDSLAASAAAEQAAILAAKAHAKLAALKAMTPAQVEAWVNANVTTLAQAKDVLATLAVAVNVLARRL